MSPGHSLLTGGLIWGPGQAPATRFSAGDIKNNFFGGMKPIKGPGQLRRIDPHPHPPVGGTVLCPLQALEVSVSGGLPVSGRPRKIGGNGGEMGGNGGEMGGNGELLQIHHGKCCKKKGKWRKMGGQWVKNGTRSGNFPIFPRAHKSFLRGPLRKFSLQVSSGKTGEIQGLRRSPDNRRLQRVATQLRPPPPQTPSATPCSPSMLPPLHPQDRHGRAQGRPHTST